MRPWARQLAVLCVLLFSLLSRAAVAQAPDDEADDPAAEEARPEAIPRLRRSVSLGELAGQPITRIEVVTRGGRWPAQDAVTRVRIGEPLSGEVARRALRELTDTGHYASVDAEAVAEGRGVVLRLSVLPRKIVRSIRTAGTRFDEIDVLQAAGVEVGSEITAPLLSEISKRLGEYYDSHGFPAAVVDVEALDTDDPTTVVLRIEVDTGKANRVRALRFRVKPKNVPGLGAMLGTYAVATGDRVDVERLETADRDLEARLKKKGWYQARVGHHVVPMAGGAALWVDVLAGPLYRPVFEGNRYFDDERLEKELASDDVEDRTPDASRRRLRDFYVRRGFLDVEIRIEERGGANDAIHDLVFKIRPNPRVRVAAREFPCLEATARANGEGRAPTKKRTPDDLGSEIDSFLSEELPGAVLFELPNPQATDETFGPRGEAGTRVVPIELNPWNTYVPEVYERALEHVQGLYRSEGFLSATVGPVSVLRRRCSRFSPAGGCIPLGRLRRPTVTCHDAEGVPTEDPPIDKSLQCVPDPARGIRCEPNVVLHIPVKRGPQTELYDVAFEGNQLLVEKRLAEVAALELGKPVSQVDVEAARRRVLEEYAEQGFAYAEVDVVLDLSPDRTRARARFIISEREQVLVIGVRIRGATRTNESLILRRVALVPGQPYRRSLIRKTEERLATLGVFSSVVVGLEDPYIPAREKVVLITVQERPVQFLETRPGVSTGEGFRVAFEYGHRNIGGEAIQFTLSVRLSLLPSIFIIEDDVRRNFDALPLKDRLERRNRIGVEFPEIGLGPLIRFGIDGIDIRDNARDFGLTSEKFILTLTYRPNPRFSAQLGGSVELNDAEIFSGESLDDFLRTNQSPVLRRLLRVPDGRTFAFAERIGFAWDRRDNPFGATQGTFFGTDVEHVSAFPASDNPNTITSDFLRFTGRVAGYVRMSDDGLALALSLQGGYNVQLRSGSATYPDRLHFLGGVDTLRGFFQDSLVPQDVADQIRASRTQDLAGVGPVRPALRVEDVAIRGGDLAINPRAELRIPLGGIVSTALFVDAGNLWVDPKNVEPFNLRYAAGSGLRFGTPVGPVALDYGVNLMRRRELLKEDFGAFHFSIGLF